MKSSWLAAAAVVGFLSAGCASTAKPAGAPAALSPGGSESERELPIPADLAPRIRESIEVGRMLYFLDKASAIGTDVAIENVPDLQARGVGGWLTMRSAGESGRPAPAFTVLFVSAAEPLTIQFRVQVPLSGKPTFAEMSPPKPLDDIGVRLFHARQAAIRSVPASARKWNPVILPGATLGLGNSILVYLLAAEERAGEMVLGVHYRVIVSADGTTVKAALPLSRSALVIPPIVDDPRVPPGARRDCAVVSHNLTDWPLETHVFVSMLHQRVPIYVLTRRGVWRVTGDKIALVDDKPPAPPARDTISI